MSESYSETYSTGPGVPPEALQQGSMNQHHPHFKMNEGDEPEVDGVQVGVVEGGRQKYILPGKYPLKPKRLKDIDGKVIIVKGLTRVDH